MIKNALTFIYLLIIQACSNQPDVENTTQDVNGLKTNEVYIVNHGWHTGFVMSTNVIYQHLPELKERFGETPSLEFGWGDKGFYKAKEITTGLVLRAILWPTESVVHVVSVPTKAPEYFPNSEIVKICLSDAEYSGLVRFMVHSFGLDENKNINALTNGIYGNSQFYKGTGDYYLFNTCNKWTAKGLASSGMDISINFKLTASSIMDYLYTLSTDLGGNQYACSH